MAREVSFMRISAKLMGDLCVFMIFELIQSVIVEKIKIQSTFFI